MGLRSKIQKKVGKAFDKKLNDAVKTIYFEVDVDSFDPATNTVTDDDSTADVETRGVVSRIKESDEKDGSKKPYMFKMIILQNELDTTPYAGQFVKWGNHRAKTLLVDEDPAAASWVLSCLE